MRVIRRHSSAPQHDIAGNSKTHASTSETEAEESSFKPACAFVLHAFHGLAS
jgi:hypothetical protein